MLYLYGGYMGFYDLKVFFFLFVMWQGKSEKSNMMLAKPEWV